MMIHSRFAESRVICTILFAGALAVCALGIGVGAGCWAYQILTGLGAVGINVPVAWSTYLVNFVFWVGLADGSLSLRPLAPAGAGAGAA